MSNIFTPDSFWSRVNKTETCWLWTGHINSDGYGQLSVYGYTERAHRVSWMLSKGIIPAGKLILHKCDIRNCVNPEHLFIGNDADNTLDMVNKGRSHHPKFIGELNNAAKLTEQTVKQIRALNGFIERKNLALIFNLTPSQICNVVKRKSWKHIFSSQEEIELIRNQWASQYV